MIPDPILGLADARRELADFLRGADALLVTGARSFSACGARDALAEPLRAAARLRPATHAGDLLSLEELDATFDRLRDAAPGRIVAVGGGAILDTAKIIALAFATGRTPGELAAGVPADIAPPPVFAVLQYIVQLLEIWPAPYAYMKPPAPSAAVLWWTLVPHSLTLLAPPPLVPDVLFRISPR